MTRKNKLTRAVVKRFLQDPSAIDLNFYALIDGNAAALLAEYAGKYLMLNGIEALPAEAANGLAQYTGYRIELNGLHELDEAAAKCLAQYAGPLIELNGLTRISTATARALAAYAGRLDLDGVTALSDLAAARLGKHRGPYLSLNGITTLSSPAADALSRHRGYVSLCGLTVFKRAMPGGDTPHLSLTAELDSASPSSATTSTRANAVAALGNDAISKIQYLLKSKTADGVELGLLQMAALNATSAVYEAVFTEPVIRSMIGRSEAESWDTVAKALVPHHAALELLEKLSAAVARPAFLAAWGEAAQPRKSFIDLSDIPAGSFTMGSPNKEANRGDDENRVRVHITKPFKLGRTVVTQGQWRAVMGTEPWRGGLSRYGRYDGLDEAECGNNFPAVWVSWDDAVLFCKTLTALERELGRLTATQGYRLPTEAEWEYACRAGTTTAYSFGDAPKDLDEHGWYGDNSGGSLYVVASKKPNPWGLVNMHGSVCEWCADWYAGSLEGGDDPGGPTDGVYRVARGGHGSLVASACRSARRFYRFGDSPGGYFGFRVVNAETDQAALGQQAGSTVPAGTKRSIAVLDRVGWIALTEAAVATTAPPSAVSRSKAVIGGTPKALKSKASNTAAAAVGKPEIKKIRELLGAESSDAVALGLSLLDSLGLDTSNVERLLPPETEASFRFCAHQWLRDGSPQSVEHFMLYHRLLVEPRFLLRYRSRKASKPCLIEMVDIPAGTFLMGSPLTEVGRSEDENQVSVTISRRFRMARSVITQCEWEQVMGVEPWWWDGIAPYQEFLRSHGLESSLVPPPSVASSRPPTVDACCPFLKFNTGDDVAAFAVSWHSASLYCKILTQLEHTCGLLAANESYSLPSEAEWEYACRATTRTAYAFGDSLERKTSAPLWVAADGLLALCDSHPPRYAPSHLWISGPGARPVRTKPPNPWGLYDMHGNVHEWCEDWYHPVLGGGLDPRGPGQGRKKCLRGGNIQSKLSECRSASRFSEEPTYRSSIVGFRIIARTTGPGGERPAPAYG